MPALTLSLLFVAYLALVGRAALEACRWRGGVLRAWLLAPATGLAVVLLLTTILNQAGLPVGNFAWPLTLILAAAAAVVLARRRTKFPGRALGPFAAVAAASVFWTGWPHLRFNFDWLSYVNDDFVNYALAAERFKDFGFWRTPTLGELAGKDITQYYWFMHVPGLMRFGAELTLSWVSALTGIKSLRIFMPVIVGLGVIQLCSAAALTLHHGRWRRRAWVAMALLAASPLFMLGTLYQLIAQVGGLGLMLAALVFLTRRLAPGRAALWSAVAGLSLVGAALAVFYPEVTAFAVLVGVAYAAIEAVRNRSWPVARTRLFLYGVVGVLVLLHANVLTYVFTIMLQMGQGFRSVDLSLSLFPYFMIPTGLANLFGLMPLAVQHPEPLASATIAAGLFMLLACLWSAAREAARPAPMALLLLVQFALALRLMTSGNDFGLYKVAMFIQPALAAAGAALLTRGRPAWTAPAAVALVALACAPAALHYTRVSQGEQAGGLTEAKLASALGTTAPPVAKDVRVLADINNLVAAKVAAFELRGNDVRFLSRDYYQQIAPIEYERLGDTLLRLHPRFDELLRTRRMLAERDAAITRTHRLFDTTFIAPAVEFAPGPGGDAYLRLDPALGLFNKFKAEAPARPSAFFRAEPAAAVRNHLVFVHSGRGNHYYLGDRNRIAIYQPEADLYTDRQDMTGIGRFLLLRVERPDEDFFLRIAATKTFMGSGHTAWSPGARILAEQDVPLRFTGNGAVNRIIGPVRPVKLDGAAYLAIDLNEAPVQFPSPRAGLQAMYNTVVPLDSRKLVAYARDLSVVSRAELAALRRPDALRKFPDDLVFARGLEFAGVYEDAWLSPESEFTLSAGKPGGVVRLRGEVPELPGSGLGAGTLRARVNGREFILPAKSGEFDWLLPLPETGDATRLALAFSATTKLAGGDGRPVGGKLRSIEVVAGPATGALDFAEAAGRPRLPSEGLDADGWMQRKVRLAVPGGSARILVLKVEFPEWSGKKSGTLETGLDGQATRKSHPLVAGQYALIEIPLPPSDGLQVVEMGGADDFPLPAPDNRRRTGRLVSAELKSAAP